MKYIALLLFVSVASVAYSATINLGNLNTLEDSNAITDSTGVRLEPGSASVQVGYFTGDINSLSLDTLVQNFNPYGTILDFGAGLGAAGLFQGAITGDLLDGTEFAGKTLYVVITNSASGISFGGTTDATELLVWDPGSTFSSSEPYSPTFNIQTGEGSVVFGGSGIFQVAFTEFDSDVEVLAFSLVAIPEPSTFLLGAIGALGLLRRRR